MPEKKPGNSPMINMNSSSRKPNPMATAKPAQSTPALAQPSGSMPRKAMPGTARKSIDPQFGVTLKKKATAAAIAKKRAAIKREAY